MAIQPRQRERLTIATLLAEGKIRSIAPDCDGTAKSLLAASVRARTAPQRVLWLQRAASAWARPMEKVSACRDGCCHCCHIPVTISRIEANLLGKATGRVPRRPASIGSPKHARIRGRRGCGPVAAAGTDRPVAVPVPSQRPMLGLRASPRCLPHPVNLDDDDLLCRRAEDGQPASVPYADARAIKALVLAAQAGSEFADIREFFPGQGRV